MTQEEQQEIDRICNQAADRITELEAHLSSKEQECHKYKKLYDTYATGPVINPLYADNGELCGYSLISRDTGETLCSEEDKERFDALDQMILDATRKEMRLESELASLRAEKDKWREDCIHNANRALEIVAERDKWHSIADEHSAKALEFSDSLRYVRSENDRLNKEISYYKSDNHPMRIANAAFERACDEYQKENEKLKEQKYEWFEEHQTLSEHYINLQSEQKTLRKRCEDLEAALTKCLDAFDDDAVPVYTNEMRKLLSQ